ncbi:sulfite exporter TauE/SafE family protein 2 [Selaginella moellendorffii]|uniref:sulfite exporter TauE/SafE family protein 2 n=1 Tax=Selaginella moellendorffii TaxID=88036 RepID=UPI000D1CFBEE|nr:sulfite exporter TauE/SafE family protein 2 [Selaginella moellendorffii]|eukprot:XP_024520298.1 sulfite exporter TauE/SafE family protein 2 [Selaginella moellendorffii]
MSSNLYRFCCGAGAFVALIACIAAAAGRLASSSSPRNFSPNLLRDGSEARLVDFTDARTIIASILGAIGAAVSSAGGIGGGGLYVPLFNLLLRFNTRTAAVLSNFMIFGGMIANMMWSAFQRDPFDDERPLIDFDAALLMQPNMLLGISLGVLCNLMFPGWLITLLLTITLAFVTFRSFNCGFRLWKAESGSNSSDGEGKSAKYHDAEAPLLDSAEIPHRRPRAAAAAMDPPEEGAPDSEKLGCCSVGFPALKLAGLLLVWLFFFAVQLLRGSKTSEGYFHLDECGLGYWLITGSQLPLTLLFTVWTIREATVSTVKNPSKWNSSRSNRAHLTLPLMALLAGILGGLLGIGGGMLISPILLEMGMPPQVTAATSAFMVFFSSSLSVAQYWLMGRIPVEFALWFSGICFVFSLVGLLVVQRAIQRYGRASIIVFLVTSVMGLSALLMAGFGGMDVWKQYERGDYMGFRSPC